MCGDRAYSGGIWVALALGLCGLILGVATPVAAAPTVDEPRAGDLSPPTYSHTGTTEFVVQTTSEISVIQGETWDNEIEVTNEGDAAGSQTITYEVGPIYRETEMYLEPGETDTWYLTIDSDQLSTREYEQVIETPSSRDDLNIQVKAGPPEFLVGNLRVEQNGEQTSRIKKGESAEVHFAILNDGEGGDTQFAKCYVASEYVGDEVVELEPEEAEDNLECSFDTSDLSPGTYEYGVETNNDQWYKEIVITEPARPPTITDADPSGSVQLNGAIDDQEEFSVDVSDPDSSYYDISREWFIDGDSYGMSDTFEVSSQDLSPGTHTVEVVVNDNQAETAAVSREWTVDIESPPEIDAATPDTESVTINPDESETFAVTVDDPDTSSAGLDLDWEVDGERVGSGSSIELDGDELSSGSHTLSVSVSDGSRITNDVHTEWTVDAQAGPTIHDIQPDRSTVRPGEAVNFGVDATDPNHQGIRDVTWEIRGNEYTGESIEHTFTDVGTYDVTVTVRNEAGLETTETTEVTAEPIAPTVESTGPQPSVVDIGEPVELQADATDPNERPLDFEYQWQSETGVTDDQESTTMRFDEVGEHRITLTVTNKYGAETTRTFTVTVQNDRPTVTKRNPSQDTKSVTTNEHVRFAADVTNRDASAATVSLAVDGSTVESKQLTSDEQEMSFQHAFTEAGEKTVSVSVEDAHGAESKTTWEMDVRSRPPEFQAMSPDESQLSIMSGESRRFEVRAVDPEGKDVEYQWSQDGSRIDVGSSITKTFSTGGTYDIAVEAADSQGRKTTQSWSVNVQSFREPPTKNTHLSKLRIDPESERVTKTFLTVSMENPTSNDRTVVVEFIIDTPDGLEVVRQRGVSASNNAQITGVGRLEPGEQRSMRVGLRIADKSLIGSDVPINRTIRYYPASQPDDITYIRQSDEEISIRQPGIISAIASWFDSIFG